MYGLSVAEQTCFHVKRVSSALQSLKERCLWGFEWA